MTLKSQVAGHVAGVVREVKQRVEELPGRVDDAGQALGDWRDRARRLVRKNPGLVILGAFAIGFALAKVARHA